MAARATHQVLKGAVVGQLRHCAHPQMDHDQGLCAPQVNIILCCFLLATRCPPRLDPLRAPPRRRVPRLPRIVAAQTR